RIVGNADACGGIVFHHHLVAAQDQFMHARRGQPDPVFLGLDLLRNADLHATLLPPLLAGTIGPRLACCEWRRGWAVGVGSLTDGGWSICPCGRGEAVPT